MYTLLAGASAYRRHGIDYSSMPNGVVFPQLRATITTGHWLQRKSTPKGSFGPME